MLTLGAGDLTIELNRLERVRELNRPTRWIATASRFADTHAEDVYSRRAEEWSLRWELDGETTELAAGLQPVANLAQRVFELAPAWLNGDDLAATQYRLVAGHDSFLGLLQPYQSLLDVSDPDVRTLLAGQKVRKEFTTDAPGDGVAPFVLQSRLTDLEFIRFVLLMWNQRFPESQLALSCDERWTVVPTWKVDTPGELPEDDTWTIRGFTADDSVDAPRIGGLAAPRLHVMTDRPFAPGLWQTESEASLPHGPTIDGRPLVAGRRSDTLEPGRGGVARLNWGIELLLSEGPYTVREGWLGHMAPKYVLLGGVVTSTQGAKCKVELDGLTSDPRVVECALFTPSTGKDESRGVHFVPYPKSRVLVAIAQDPFCNPPVCLGNVRHSDPGEDAPWISFEDGLLMQSDQCVQASEGRGAEWTLIEGQLKVNG